MEILPPKGRPYIGRKGIGKLALLSCANKITVISKKIGGEYVGGVIDNSELDTAITDDRTPQQYPLGAFNESTFNRYTRGHGHGTIIYFEGIKDGIKNSLEFLQKIIALYFRFSLVDKSFNIFLDGEKITHKHLDALAQKTEFLWKINKYRDPYVQDLESRFTSEHNEKKKLKANGGIKGFIASVQKPTNLKIMTTEERVGVDLFVNGRLRERDLLKHIPTARVAESYLYGQIHFNGLDDKLDRFTSSREGIVADDPKFNKFLEDLRKKILEIVNDWDTWRIKHRQTGDPENDRLSKKDRASLGLYDAVSGEYDLPARSGKKKKVDSWVDELKNDAMFNFESYAECFISENLIRKYVKDTKTPLSIEAIKTANDWKNRETENKKKGNLSIKIRRVDNKASYLAMNDLAYLVEKKKDHGREISLIRDADEYKPMRDAIAHTSLLTDVAKKRLTAVYENIKARVKNLLQAG